jgi:hypothetical protein
MVKSCSKPFFSWLTVGLIFGLAAHAVAQPRHATETSAGDIRQMFLAASEIDIYHTPEALMGRVGLNAATASQNWVSLAIYRCRASCIQEAPHLLKLLSGAHKVNALVTGDISTIILFKNGDKEVGKIVSHWSGRAFLIGTQVYVLDNSLAGFLETHSPLQW